MKIILEKAISQALINLLMQILCTSKLRLNGISHLARVTTLFQSTVQIKNPEILCPHPAFLFCYQILILNHLFKNKYVIAHVTYCSFPLVLMFINKLNRPCLFGVFFLLEELENLIKNLQ